MTSTHPPYEARATRSPIVRDGSSRAVHKGRRGGGETQRNAQSDSAAYSRPFFALRSSAALCALCVLVSAFLPFAGAGCASAPGEITDGPAYPVVAQSSVLDVQVFRDETRITLTNTSPRTFGPCRVWVNQWYGLDLPGLVAGETITLELGRFTDRYGTPFRAGGFFATERPDRLVIAQIEEQGTLTGLVVVGTPIE